MDEVVETECNGYARGWQSLPEHVPSPRLFAKIHAASLGPVVFCCGDVIVCHIWQCLPQRSKGHCVLVTSGNAQPSPRGRPLLFLPQLEIVRQGGCCLTLLVLCLHGVGVRVPAPEPVCVLPCSPTHMEVWTFCRTMCCA